MTLFKRIMERFSGKDRKGAPDVQAADESERREYARLVYPPTDRPKFVMAKFETEIIDISERGIKFLKDEQAKQAALSINLHQNLDGKVLFSSGKSLEITGKVMWQFEQDVGLLVGRIPLEIILEEIRGLLRRKSMHETELSKPFQIAIMANEFIEIMNKFMDKHPTANWSIAREALNIAYRKAEDADGKG